jgi:hypothetical protein
VFERFTGRARRVLVLALEEAQLLQHNFIGTEHLLLGLTHLEESTAAKALESLGISLEGVRALVAETTGPAGSSPTGSPPFTPRAKKVLELSLREALQLGHNYIGTEHLLLGIVREGEGVAAQILVNLGADLSRVRQRVMELVQRGGRQPTDPAREAFRRRVMQLFAIGGQVCALCGRDLSEVDRYISANTINVCDRCITDGHQVLEEAEGTGDGPELHLPPRVLGEVPDNDAVPEIVMAFERGLNVSDPVERRLYLEDAERLRPYAEQVAARFPDAASTFRLERIQFLLANRARVHFWITVTSPSMTFPVDGAAVRIDGRWKVSRGTQVLLLERAGVQIPDALR